MLNINNPIPLHIQLKQLIHAEIREGKYVDKIPSERELMDRFQVSRSTVRESINHLVNEQILEKVHGKGTYIRTKKKISDWLNTLHSFTETVKNMGMTPSAKLIAIENDVEDLAIQRKLNNSAIFTFTRLRKADQKPIAIERHYYAQSLGNQLKQFDLNASTIYDLLEQELNIVLVEAEQTIKVIPISERDASFLNIVPGTNVLCVERIIYGMLGEPIEFYRSVFHPSYYELKLKTRRHH